jgi:proteasome activator subunit 4
MCNTLFSSDMNSVLNSNLPYETLADGEKWLKNICQGLFNCVKAGNYAPGVLFWTRSLNTFLNLKYTLSLEQRCDFANLFYSLIHVPQLDTFLVELFAATATNLLRQFFFILLKKVFVNFLNGIENTI